jgi:hypothetical protein
VPPGIKTICRQLFIALSIGEFLPNRLVAPLYGTLCPTWPLDEVCAAALSFIFYGERRMRYPHRYTQAFSHQSHAFLAKGGPHTQCRC